ncbi:DUF5009 domain-containing protein [Hymenobacter persicinus]|uniref:DUF5009 domain-containing protein n=2 Tax=Hymenobacter persicinus TaxID=2025506 RepID=A0A4Q5LAU7_9BACT|nr:DUF5009 domain-containing protein [Hymenobacter persicinus]
MAMMLVNFPGSYAYFTPLTHADWHGFHLADLVFPCFLFIVGVSLSFALGRARLDPAQHGPALRKALRRTLILLLLGMFIDLVPRFYFTSFRSPGVLQRIGLVSLACAALFLKTDWRRQLAVLAALLIGYSVLLQLVPVPGYGPANLDPVHNLGAWLDRLVFTRHHLLIDWDGWDPESLLGTLPAIGTGVLGLLAGQWLRRPSVDAPTKVAWLLVAGFGLIVLGLIWSGWFPLNKQLWTSSYVLYTGGIAAATLGALYWLCDVQGWRRGFTLPLVFGTNAITVYALSELGERLLSKTKVAETTATGEPLALRTYLFEHFVAPHFAVPELASLFYAVAYTAIWGLVAWLLYRRRIFLKI